MSENEQFEEESFQPIQEDKPIISMANLIAIAMAVTAVATTKLYLSQRSENIKICEASKELLRIYHHNINVANNFQAAASNNQASAEYWAGQYANLTNWLVRRQGTVTSEELK